MVIGTRIWGVFGAMALLLLAGCQDPAHQQQVDMRCENLQRTVGIAEDVENERCGNLARTLGILETKHREDVERTANLPRSVDEFFERDALMRRQEAPINKKNAEHVINGDCPNAKRTLPLILY